MSPIGPGSMRSSSAGKRSKNVTQGSAGTHGTLRTQEMSTPRASRRTTGNDVKGGAIPEIRAAPPGVTSQAHSRTSCGAGEGNDVRKSAGTCGRHQPAQPTLNHAVDPAAAGWRQALPVRCY
jgi:hypothetical protein